MGMTDAMLIFFPFLIRDKKTSKRNCGGEEKKKKKKAPYNHSLSIILTILFFLMVSC